MDDETWQEAQFERHRSHLVSVAYRMLGSRTDAEDAVQEARVRLRRSDEESIGNVGGWLTTVVGRVCIERLRARRAPGRPADTSPPASARDVPTESLLAESMGLALLVVLEALQPAERTAFVLHDLFAMPFDEIAPIVDRSPETTRLLVGRARLRIRGASGDTKTDRESQGG